MILRKLVLPVAALGLLFMINSCDKETSSGSTYFKVRLTDNPIDADQVNVDIEEVRVNYADDSSGWVSLATNAGIYDLLGLQNGVDTLLAADSIPTGVLKEIRLVLGNDNTIMVDSVVYPLTIPSGSSSGLKLKLQKSLHPHSDSLVIDFDAALSVHQTGTGEYQLRPVLRIQ